MSSARKDGQTFAPGMLRMLGRGGVVYITSIYGTFTASVSDGRRNNATAFSPFVKGGGGGERERAPLICAISVALYLNSQVPTIFCHRCCRTLWSESNVYCLCSLALGCAKTLSRAQKLLPRGGRLPYVFEKGIKVPLGIGSLRTLF
jgi:hypothetical protein